MRQWISLLIACLLLVGAAPPAQGEESPSLAAILSEAANAKDQPEFKTLGAALKVANPSFWQMLADPKANVTLFAPSDAAFAQWLKTQPADVLRDTKTLDGLLAYHLIPGVRLNVSHLKNLNTAIIGTLLPEQVITLGVMAEGIQLNEATIRQADTLAANGVMHVLDRVLTPDHMPTVAEQNVTETTLADALLARGQANDQPAFTSFRIALQTADPMWLDMLGKPEQYTVFAPTDAGFAQSLAKFKLSSEQFLKLSALTNVVRFHIVPGRLSSSTLSRLIPKAGVRLATLLPGQAFWLTMDNGVILANDMRISQADVTPANGMLYQVDGLLLPRQE
jgi:uncharacterized surface protein with fasciclin (FAS1) repeats